MLQFAAVEPSSPDTRVLDGEGMLKRRWFQGMTLNYAWHMLRFSTDRDALLFESEEGEQRRMSAAELRQRVARCAGALKEDGVKKGDRVAGYLPNLPETIVAMLATASLGAVCSSCSPVV